MKDHLPPLSYAPDGLYESDVNALISEYFTADPVPYTISDPATNQHVRSLNGQNISAELRVRSHEHHHDTHGTAA